MRKPADPEVVRLLASAGVRISCVEVPAEAREPHGGAALGYDDLLDFALWLDGHDALAALLGARSAALTGPSRVRLGTSRSRRAGDAHRD